jgi:hypothetical protein
MNPIQLWQKYPRLCRSIYISSSGDISEWKAACLLAAGPEAVFTFDDGQLVTAWDLVDHAYRGRRGMRYLQRERSLAHGRGRR